MWGLDHFWFPQSAWRVKLSALTTTRRHLVNTSITQDNLENLRSLKLVSSLPLRIRARARSRGRFATIDGNGADSRMQGLNKPLTPYMGALNRQDPLQKL